MSKAVGPRLLQRLERLLPQWPDARLCVAWSGGLDSTALLAMLAAQRSRGFGLRAVHVDHGLHPNSRSWSAHCRRIARQLGVPLKVITVSVVRGRGGSLEAAARNARYACLGAQLAEGEALLTAHHQDDQLETVLLQLFRGCGLAGLAAMPPVAPLGRGLLVRPLLDRTHAELEAWVRGARLTWVEDDTNADERFDRNFLRARVLPAVRERWSGVAAAAGRTARHAAEGQRLLEALARADIERCCDGAALSAKALRTLSVSRRRNALRLWIASRGKTLPDARRLAEIAGAVLDARPDAHPQVAWGHARIERHADRLVLADIDAQPEAAEAPTEIGWDAGTATSCELPGPCGRLELKPDPHGPVDLDALQGNLTVRWRRGGERLRPRRGGARRTLKSLLQEARVPLAERSRLPLVFRGDELLAAGDLWVDESVRASAATGRRGRLIWTRARDGLTQVGSHRGRASPHGTGSGH